MRGAWATLLLVQAFYGVLSFSLTGMCDTTHEVFSRVAAPSLQRGGRAACVYRSELTPLMYECVGINPK